MSYNTASSNGATRLTRIKSNGYAHVLEHVGERWIEWSRVELSRVESEEQKHDGWRGWVPCLWVSWKSSRTFLDLVVVWVLTSALCCGMVDSWVVLVCVNVGVGDPFGFWGMADGFGLAIYLGVGDPLFRWGTLKYINILDFILVHQVCRFNVQSPVGWSFWGHF